MMDYGGKYSLDDEHLVSWFREIIDDNGIDLVVETGTHTGHTTAKFCQMARHVISIDVDPECARVAEETLRGAGVDNYRLVTANAPDALRALAADGIITGRTLVFIDAHMHPDSYWPLPDEIRALPKGVGILAFHDIWVPDRDFLGSKFLHDGQVVDFTYEVMQPYLSEWSASHRVEYNREASGSYCGVAVVYP